MKSRPGPQPEAKPPARKKKTRLIAARSLLRIAFQVIRPRRPYEPVELGGRRYAQKRESDARWAAIAQTIHECDVQNILDIGCAEGWFLRRAAEDFGCFGIGVEAEERRILVGELARLHDGTERVAVIKARLSPPDILNLPACDLVLCLSVVHHIMREGGLEAAREFVRALSTRARKAVLFEMGTSEEAKLGWTSLLPDMPEGQEKFIRDMLLASGLTNIRVLATTPGLKQDALRLLFFAEPQRAVSPQVDERYDTPRSA